LSLSPNSLARSGTVFVPAGFVPPAVLETARFRLRMLTINDLEQDYAAVMSSVEHLQKVFQGDWPKGLSREQNLIDLGWHQKEFQRRTSFAYTVVRPDESLVLGCVYIYPSGHPGFDAEVYLWVRESELAGGLDQELELQVRGWLAAKWPFRKIALPGRSVSWEEWNLSGQQR
jgi:hypothetical protein